MRIGDFAGQGPRDNHRNRRCLADLGAGGGWSSRRFRRTQLCLGLDRCGRLAPGPDRRNLWRGALLQGRKPRAGSAGIRAAKRLGRRSLWRRRLDKFHRLRRNHILGHRRFDRNSDSRQRSLPRLFRQSNLAAHLGRRRQHLDRLLRRVAAKPLRRLQLKQAGADHADDRKGHGCAKKVAVVKCNSGLLNHNCPAG